MNYNIAVICDTCGAQTNCRLGLSNRDVQPLRFRCKSCGSPIDITMTLEPAAGSTDIQVKGAKKFPVSSFEADVNFVDLHLDFPVSFAPYVMGQTPFMRAVQRVGHESIQIHGMRVNWLNEVHKESALIKSIFTLYGNEKHELFKEKAMSFLGQEMPCDTHLDRNRALYYVIEKAFFPFAEPVKNANFVNGITKLMIRLAKKDKASLDAFLTEIISTDFLRNVQRDCLEIYPRIIDIELMLRPALFLDFDRSYASQEVPYRVSAHEFNDAKDLYKDITEILGRLLSLVAGLNNLKHRNSHNLFAPVKDAPKSLENFADLPLGRKLSKLDRNWYHLNTSVFDNHLRNSVAHYKAEYNEISQKINYFPKQEGLKQDQGESLYFLDFSRKVLVAFRELHRLNHLTKCLYVYYFMKMLGEPGTSLEAEYQQSEVRSAV